MGLSLKFIKATTRILKPGTHPKLGLARQIVKILEITG